MKDCGGQVIVENYVHARSVFNRKYESNIVEWTGFFIESRSPKHLSAISQIVGSEHFMNVIVKMSPSESELYPDIALSLSTKVFSHIKKEID